MLIRNKKGGNTYLIISYRFLPNVLLNVLSSSSKVLPIIEHIRKQLGGGTFVSPSTVTICNDS